ncbi:MAG: YhcH/YjgK/YiaL family protein [Acutalibacteraceae bacterium]|jgi:biofilm protein TabA
MIFDTIAHSDKYFGVNEKFLKAFDFIKKATAENLPAGKYEIDGKEIYASVQEYTSKLPQDGKFDGHRDYIDIQYIISGTEIIEVVDISKAKSKTEYNPDKDVEFYEDSDKAVKAVLESGEYGIFFAHDIHKPGLAIGGVQSPVKKIVVKVKI